MEQAQVFEKVVSILTPFVKNKDALAKVAMETSILQDLKVNSARLVDMVLEMEEAFDIQVSDSEADGVNTVGDAVRLVLGKAK
jgi:acyl carrier protein